MLDQAEIDALEAIFVANRHEGFDRVVKAVRLHPFSAAAAALLQPDDKWGFRANVSFLARCTSASLYGAHRVAQLVEARFALWVYRAGDCDPYRELDGLALPPDHPFWATCFPPNGPGCSCRVFGTRSEKGALRLGGDPGLVLPSGWRGRFPVAEGFEGPPPFPFATFLRSLIAQQRDASPDRA